MKKLITTILSLSISLILFNSCSSDIDDLSNINNIDNIASNENEIEDDLKDLIEEVSRGELDCIEFIYPINLILYNNLNEEIGTENVVSNDEFIELLTTLDINNSLSISYPITGINGDNEEFTVNDNDELAEAIKLCKQFIIIGQCNNIIENIECVWEVSHVNNDGLDTYQNSIFRISDDDLLQYYHNGETYRGAWFFYFINDSLHLNINMNDNSLGLDWNFDWEVIYFDDDFFEIKIDDKQFILDKICPPCEELTFEECQIENTVNTAIFNLNSYTSCIYNSENIINSQDYDISFYELLDDAENDINSITSNLYTSIVQTQIIYVRIDDTITNTYTTSEINLSIIECN